MKQSSFWNLGQNYLSKHISVGNNSFFSQFWESKFEFEWDIANHRMFIYVPIIPTDKFIREILTERK